MFTNQEVGGGDISATVLQMLYHIKEANAVFIAKVKHIAITEPFYSYSFRILTIKMEVTAWVFKLKPLLSLKQNILMSIYCWGIMTFLRFGFISSSFVFYVFARII